MDLTSFPELTTEQQRAIQEYTLNLVMEKLANAQRAQQETVASHAQANKEWREAQPDEQGSRGSDNVPTDRLVEGLT